MTATAARRRRRRQRTFVAIVTAVFAVTGAFLAAPAANAMKSTFSVAQLCRVLQPCEPPPRYASGPFLAKPVVRHVSMREVQIICGGGHHALLGNAASGFTNDILGCARLADGACVVHVPRNLKAVLPELYELVLAHELGHCRGWVHRRY